MVIIRIIKKTHMKYSKASSFAFLISYNSSAISTRLVGSMLYFDSNVSGDCAHGYIPSEHGESVSGTGPAMSEGQMTDSAFSKYKVSNLPEGECELSKDDTDDVRLKDGVK